MLKIYAKLMFTMFFWGGTFIAGRMLAQTVAPFSAAFLRFAIAGLILLAVLRQRQGRLPGIPRHLWLPILWLGLSGVFAYNVLFFWGLQSVPAGRASVIIANNPVFIALCAALLFKEPLGWARLLGVLISISGALVAISRGDLVGIFNGGLSWGDLMIFGCVLSWVTFSLIGKSVIAHLSPLTAITYAVVVGAGLLFPPAVLEGMISAMSGYAAADWASLAYLGVFGTALGFVWYYQGIERTGAARAGLFINFVPISAIVLAALLLGEPITGSLIVGTAMVLGGVYLTNNGPPRLQRFKPAAIKQ